MDNNTHYDSTHNHNKHNTWMKLFFKSLVNRMLMIVLLLIVAYVIHRFTQWSLSLVVQGVGFGTICLGGLSGMGSTRLGHDYNYRMSQIGSSNLVKHDRGLREGSSKFMLSTALVGIVILVIGYAIG